MVNKNRQRAALQRQAIGAAPITQPPTDATQHQGADCHAEMAQLDGNPALVDGKLEQEGDADKEHDQPDLHQEMGAGNQSSKRTAVYQGAFGGAGGSAGAGALAGAGDSYRRAAGSTGPAGGAIAGAAAGAVKPVGEGVAGGQVAEWGPLRRRRN